MDRESLVIIFDKSRLGIGLVRLVSCSVLVIYSRGGICRIEMVDFAGQLGALHVAITHVEKGLGDLSCHTWSG